MYYYDGHMGSFFGFGMVIFWGAFVWLIVWLIQQNNGSSPKESPLNILKTRYAKGEITKNQYETMKKEII